jgi:RNA polymerase sigma factor (sigma-70 family)
MPHTTWELTEQNWCGFLNALDADRTSAGEKYEALRSRLITFFRVRDCEPAEDWADETLDRVIRRSGETQVADLSSFALGVARRVASEAHRAIRTEPLGETIPAASQFREEEEDALLREYLTVCLQQLPAADRELLIRYYEHEKSEKIQNKKDIAEALGISTATLRVRVCRLRRQLETGVIELLNKRLPARVQ